MHSGFSALRNAMPMAIHSRFDQPEITGDLKADIERIIDIWSECLDKYEGPYLFGEYSIADMMYSPVVFRFRSYQVELPEELQKYCETVVKHPDVKDWMDDADAKDPAEPLSR